MTQRALLCPRCRKLIGSDETVCSWCGAHRPSGVWQAVAWARVVLEGDWLIKTILTVTIAYYMLSLLLSYRGSGPGGFFSSFSPDQTSLLLLGATGTVPIDGYHRYWSLLTANYLHGGILHIIFNMMALRQLAPWTAHEYGFSRMFIVYTLGGVAGYLVSYVAGIPFTIGASASLCSLIGALLYFGKNRGGAYGSAVYRDVSGWVVSLVLFGLIMPGINNWAHGGGIVGGIMLGMLLGYEERRPERYAHRILALLCAVATIVALLWAGGDAIIRYRLFS